MYKKSKFFILKSFLWYLMSIIWSFVLFSQKKDIEIIPYSFKQLHQETNNTLTTNKKPILVFLHTPWCNFCEAFKNTTLKNTEVIKALNKHFNFISFNAESKNDIIFNNNTYRYQPTGKHTGEHEIAKVLIGKNKTVSYPSFIFLNPDLEVLFQYHSWMNPQDFLKVLHTISSIHTP